MSDVLVLYQISNEFSRGRGGGGSDGGGPPSYNAYYMSRKNGVTLSTVKQSCRALRSINPGLGPDGYHWRVRIDEKPNTSHSSAGGGGSGSATGYSWEATPSELRRMLVPPPPKAALSDGDAVTQEMTKAAKGAMKYMGKAMNVVAGSAVGGIGGDDDDDLSVVRTPVICFKLLDLERVRRDIKGGGGGCSAGGGLIRRTAVPAAAHPRSQPSQQVRAAAPPTSTGAQQPQRQAHPAAARANPPTPPTADLMGFNTAASTPTPRPVRPPARSVSMAVLSTPTGAMPGETRAEKLKREYAKKSASASSRVWDDVDQRWVEGPVKNGETTTGGGGGALAAATPSPLSSGSIDGVAVTEKGITLSRSNAVGKSASVQAAVHARIDDMEQSQRKAVAELRAREGERAKADAEEDAARQRLEPRLKAWSEEHGQKKQLRALLANLHTILWEGSGWKPISLADVLDDSKVKKVYHQASRVVHPDKTGHLDAERRFVAKRVFDSLTQAKVEFDEGKR
ncbi:hypothetical protein ACHAXA_005324 [Cyclostephanos tholiformis]|uniref:J domain-containing protein n=1 Tax=Cyclostephanos tholiformis TaxID=382380 RepID=A0ABD3RQL7_9STRA